MTDDIREKNKLSQRRRRQSSRARLIDREYVKTYKRKYSEYDRDWIGHVLRQCRYRAKKKGLDFSLTREDIIVPEFCPVLGIRLERVKGCHPLQHSSSPSVDRMDNSKGYIPGNIKIISMRANQIKKDMIFEEVEGLYKYMKEIYHNSCSL